MKVILLLFFTNVCFGQLSGIIKDSKSKEPIPYVNIGFGNQNKGVSANELGEFVLPLLDDTTNVYFSAVGFVPLMINFGKLSKDVFLEQKVIQLSEVEILPRKGIKSVSLGKLNKKNIKYFLSISSPTSQLNAVYYPFNLDIAETRYLKSIKLVTRCKINNAIFNIRLFTLNPKDEPIEYYSGGNIIGKAKKGLNITEVNVEDLNIKFPENGLIVGAEWLILERNKYNQKYGDIKTGKKYRRLEYAPWFGETIETENRGWASYTNKKWHKKGPIPKEFGQNSGKYSTIAVELILTD
jgi:hypothetical protein